MIPVQVSNSYDLSSNIVVESVHGAGIDEAVSDPQTCLYNLLDLTQYLGNRRTATNEN